MPWLSTYRKLVAHVHLGSNYSTNPALIIKNVKENLTNHLKTLLGKGGQSIWGGNFNDEINDSLKHNVRGIVSMANSGPNTNKSQFFISYAAQPSLDLKYTAFGKVIDGFDALDALEKVPVNEKYKPVKETRLRFITIHANPLAEESHDL